jgi:hypothetical protein
MFYKTSTQVLLQKKNRPLQLQDTYSVELKYLTTEEHNDENPLRTLDHLSWIFHLHHKTKHLFHSSVHFL